MPVDLYIMTEGDRLRYDDSFGKLCSQVGPDSCVKAIPHERAPAVLSKNGLPYESLGKIWVLADADRYGTPRRRESDTPDACASRSRRQLGPFNPDELSDATIPRDSST